VVEDLAIYRCILVGKDYHIYIYYQNPTDGWPLPSRIYILVLDHDVSPNNFATEHEVPANQLKSAKRDDGTSQNL
jgi:hypothetical protein